MTETKRVVILGGGYAGSQAANRFVTALKGKTNVQVTLINKTDHFFHSVGSLRSLVEPKWSEKLFVPYDHIFADTPHKVIIGTAASITAENVVLASGENVGYDYLIIATGSAYPSPSKTSKAVKTESIAELDEIASELKKATNVLIVGGGPVGVEVAGEILTDYPDKKVTLVHSGKALMPGPYSDKFKAKLLASLQALKANVILGEKVIGLPPYFPTPVQKGWHSGTATLKTNTDRELTADFVILASGNAQFNSAPAKVLGEGVVDDKGMIKVRPTLQLEKSDNIFAIGDVNNVDYVKLAYTAAQQADIAVDNIFKLMQGGTPALKTFKAPGSTMGMVTLGRNGGVAQMFGVWGNTVTKNIKSKELFTFKSWSLLKADKVFPK